MKSTKSLNSDMGWIGKLTPSGFFQLLSGYAAAYFLPWILEGEKAHLYLLHAELSICSSSAHITKGMEVGSRRLSAYFKQQEK